MVESEQLSRRAGQAAAVSANQCRSFYVYRSPLMRVELSSIPKGADILAAQLVIVRAKALSKEHNFADSEGQLRGVDGQSRISILSPRKSFKAASHQWLWPSAAQPARNNVRTNMPRSRTAIPFCHEF